MSADPEPPAPSTELRVVGTPPFSDALGVFATVPIAAGSLILLMSGELVPRPDRYSIQLSRDLHLRGSGSMADELRHACEPNARVVGETPPPLHVVALRDIAPGEEVTIDYCATEEVLSSPFACACGSSRCYGDVRGYRFLDEAQRARIATRASPWLGREDVTAY